MKQITAKELLKKYGKECQCTLLDVREDYEYEEDHIEGAKLLPLGELQFRMDEIPKGKPVFVICRSGSRSAYATMMLSQLGYDAYIVAGGMMAFRGGW